MEDSSLARAVTEITEAAVKACVSTSASGGLRIRFAPHSSRSESSSVRAQALLPKASTLLSVPQIPQDRMDVLARFPPVMVSLNEELSRGFPRPHLGRNLGGGGQSLIANIDKTKGHTLIASAHDVNALLFPKRELNCWLPQRPGDHGFMFVGLMGPAKDNERFMESETRVLFIQGKEGDWQYYGHYDVHRDPDEDLSVTEWNVLSEDFRLGYAACTLSKRMGNAKCDDYRKKEPSKHKTDVEKIIADYDAGKLRVPCVALRCIKFDSGLVTALAERLPTSSRVAKRKSEGAESTSARGSSKRSKPASAFISTEQSFVWAPLEDDDMYALPEPGRTARKSANLQSHPLSSSRRQGV